MIAHQNVLFVPILQPVIYVLMVHSFHQMLVSPHAQTELTLIVVNANHVMLHAKSAKMELPILVLLVLAISYSKELIVLTTVEMVYIKIQLMEFAVNVLMFALLV